MIALEPSGRPDTLTVVLDGIAIGRVQLRLWRWGILPIGAGYWPTGHYPDEHAAARAVVRAYENELKGALVRLFCGKHRRTA